MSSSKDEPSALPDYFQEESGLTQECKDLMSALPKDQNTWFGSELYQYQGCWHLAASIRGTLNAQHHFQARDSDILLASAPKSGTTWLKAILYLLIHRATKDSTTTTCTAVTPSTRNALITKNPHELVLSLEFDIYHDHNQIPDISTLPSPRLFSTHLPFVSLPQSVTNAGCKVLYICREPKDTFISLWHHMNNIRSSQQVEAVSVEEAFYKFCAGRYHCGPIWDHILGYWNASFNRPDKVLFLRYEELKERPCFIVKKIAEFLDCPISLEEERARVVEEIVKLCSFDNLSNLDVNMSGKLKNGLENHAFFRKGGVGDWTNYLTPEMEAQIDQITQQKFSGTTLKFGI